MSLSPATRPFIGSLGIAVLVALAACDPAPAPRAAAKAAADEAAPPFQPSLIVRFRALHPLARAQRLEAEGRHDEAVRMARATLAAGPDLAGLCFERFTIGGAEIVLQSCTPVLSADAEAFQHDWAVRLRAMDGVEYAEPNFVATADRSS